MDVDDEVARRLAWVDRVLDAPPAIHPDADNGAVWSTGRGCYRFMADHVDHGSRTLETGAGLSTVLFAAWGCEHLAIVPSQDQAAVIAEYCTKQEISQEGLRFDLRPSETALPELAGSTELDLVFIDGCHGFPMPIIDWFYGAGLLRRGGVVVFDDVQLPQVKLLIDTFIDPDERWHRLAATKKWAAYRRLSAGPLSEEWTSQRFFPQAPASAWGRVVDVLPGSVKSLLASAGGAAKPGH